MRSVHPRSLAWCDAARENGAMIDVFGETLTHQGAAQFAFWGVLLGVGIALRIVRSVRPHLLNRTRWGVLAAAVLLLLVALSIVSLSASAVLSVAWSFMIVMLGAAGAGALVALAVFSLLEFIAPKRPRDLAAAPAGAPQR